MSTSRPRDGAPRLELKHPSHGSAVRVQQASAADRRHERRIAGQVQPRRETLTQIELPEPGAQGGLAVTMHVPRDAEAWSEIVVILVHQRAVLAVRTATSAGVLADVRSGRLQHAVARVIAKRRIEERRHEVRELIVVEIGVTEQRVAHTVVEGQALGDLPRVGYIQLDIAPALRRGPSRRRLREPPRHVLQQEIGEHVLRRRAPGREPGGAPEP